MYKTGTGNHTLGLHQQTTALVKTNEMKWQYNNIKWEGYTFNDTFMSGVTISILDEVKYPIFIMNNL